MGKMTKYGVPEYEDLKTSTRTVMVYCNLSFDLKKIFESVKVTHIEAPLTKKKKNVDKKRLEAPYGSIISLQRENQIRGIDLRKAKKHWCPACQVVVVKEEREVKVNTIEERLRTIPGTDIKEIQYFCTKCEAYFTLRQLKKIINFLNQITIVLSIDGIILNIMLFKNNFKIAGCKNDDDAVEATMILWQNYICPSKGWELRKEFIKEKHPRFLFSLVMRNVDFRLGFFIDRKELNRLMNDEKYSNKIFMSQHESTAHTNVNIKMYAKKPKGYMHDCLVLPKDKQSYFIKLRHNSYRPPKKKKAKYTTAIVFSSSEIILSGRYEQNMKDSYEFFVKTAVSNRNIIEEKLKSPDHDLMDHLNKVEVDAEDVNKISISHVKSRK
jgi:hypothetical protein